MWTIENPVIQFVDSENPNEAHAEIKPSSRKMGIFPLRLFPPDILEILFEI